MELMRDKAGGRGPGAAVPAPADRPSRRCAWPTCALLTAAQRYADAVTQLEEATRRQPEVAAPYLSLGALHLELKHPKEGEAALLRYVELVQGQPRPAAADAARHRRRRRRKRTTTTTHGPGRAWCRPG